MGYLNDAGLTLDAKANLKFERLLKNQDIAALVSETRENEGQVCHIFRDVEWRHDSPHIRRIMDFIAETPEESYEFVRKGEDTDDIERCGKLLVETGMYLDARVVMNDFGVKDATALDVLDNDLRHRYSRDRYEKVKLAFSLEPMSRGLGFYFMVEGIMKRMLDAEELPADAMEDARYMCTAGLADPRLAALLRSTEFTPTKYEEKDIAEGFAAAILRMEEKATSVEALVLYEVGREILADRDMRLKKAKKHRSAPKA